MLPGAQIQQAERTGQGQIGAGGVGAFLHGQRGNTFIQRNVQTIDLFAARPPGGQSVQQRIVQLLTDAGNIASFRGGVADRADLDP